MHHIIDKKNIKLNLKQDICKQLKMMENKIEMDGKIKIFLLNLINDLNTKKIKNIGLYFNTSLEVNTSDIIDSLDRFSLSFPRFEYDDPSSMKFVIHSNKIDDLYHVSGKIPQPKGNITIIPDIIILPVVVYNYKLFRIGSGKGMYDFYFSKYSNMNLIKIGLCYSFQFRDIDFQEKHDVSMNIIVTEKDIIFAR
jgi:5-formyltetrahydrofolate cyclo-ligase